MSNAPLWSPSNERRKGARLSEFAAHFAPEVLDDFDYGKLHERALADPAAFWSAVWDYAGIVGEKGDEPFIVNASEMPGAQFFPGARLNFAENLLHGRGEGDALVFWGEDKVKRRVSWNRLRGDVSALQRVLQDTGVGVGDRVAAMMPNMPETVAAMLAASGLGAVWSSCSPDFGDRGVLDRFGQIEPTVLITCDGYWYNGKAIDIGEKLERIVRQLPTVKTVIVVDYLGNAEAVISTIPNAQPYPDASGDSTVHFERLPFNHPLYILYSSGTTGIPKCIVHGAGGTLLQHVKEQQLLADIRPSDRFFYFTTCGWMMWNWLVSGLASEATLLLYDGSPFALDGRILFDYAETERMTHFGTSAKFIDAVKKADLTPSETHDLSSVRFMSSTGSPLAPESFGFVYESIRSDIHLASISGGTDIVSCFVGGNPWGPVYRGEIQAPGLGMAADVWDDAGKPLNEGKGELVCTQPFPSMPISFWNDPDGEKYQSAYFDRFENVWCHGDFAEWTDHGGMIIHGRSDATLNPGGVRIGTAEIYAQVEQIPQVTEALAIGQSWDDDVRVVLFVRLSEGAELDDTLKSEIKQKVRNGASPRHVPTKIIAVDDIPRTKSGKITELAVRDIVHGRAVKNQEALANPEALALFADLDELKH
ncbi:MAG: acetoacetate--CoA ligase [Pseudomonadota bacterium]